MGGSSKSSNSNTDKSVAAQPVVKYQTYGTGLDPAVRQQLMAGGLGGLLGPSSQFAPVSAPILGTPQDVEALLSKQGKSVAGDTSKSSGMVLPLNDKTMTLKEWFASKGLT